MAEVIHQVSKYYTPQKETMQKQIVYLIFPYVLSFNANYCIVINAKTRNKKYY